MDNAEKEMQQDRRRYFRVDDAVNISYQVVDQGQLPERMERMEQEVNGDFTVMSSLAAISQQMAGVMHKVEAYNPDIASYLKALDRKIDILGRAFLLQHSDVSEQATNMVNISASGVAFHVTEPLEPGALLELKLLLFPSFTGILTFAEVVGCEPLETPDGEFTHATRVNFVHLRESDRDVIIRHVIRKQSDMLREQRQQRENVEA